MQEAAKQILSSYCDNGDAVLIHQPTKEGVPSKFIAVNNAACQIYGYTREELLELTPFDLSVPENLDNTAYRIKSIHIDKYLSFQTVHLAKDGTRISVEIDARLIDLEGHFAVRSIVRDITERERRDHAVDFDNMALQNNKVPPLKSLESQVRPPSNFLNYVHNFRGIAIMFILAGHCLAGLNWEDNSFIGTLLSLFFVNGTVLFVFVAGFLFQHLSSRFSYIIYLKKKLKNVILPYLIYSAPIILVYISKIKTTGPWVIDEAFYDQSTLTQILIFYGTGAHLLAYWFIPMITLYYLIAPVLIRLDKDARIYSILPLFILISVLVERSPNILVVFLHFFSVYLFGMCFSHYRDKFLSTTAKYWYLFLLSAIILTLVDLHYFPARRYFNVIQKLLFSCLFMYLFFRYDHVIKKRFSLLADLSFALYFLHPYVLNGYHYLAARTPFYNQLQAGNFWNLLLWLTLITIPSVILLKAAKAKIGTSSRSIIGC
jgi:PAS domain S-box-containing protein